MKIKFEYEDPHHLGRGVRFIDLPESEIIKRSKKHRIVVFESSRKH